MKIALVAAEISPWAKVGGLADVIGALPNALRRAGAEPVLILPAYRGITSNLTARRMVEGLEVRLGDSVERYSVLHAYTPGGIPMYLVSHPGFFDRAEIYGERGKDYPDNFRRYIFFGRAAAQMAADVIVPDVVHAHDWHAAVTPIAMRADGYFRARFGRSISVFTIHNLAFQGLMDAGDFALLGVDRSYFTMECLEFFGRVNLMKGAIVLSDGVSTVSPTYAREVSTTAELGFGLEGVLAHKGSHFVGILNGADYSEWNPASDPFIAERYTPERPEGKRACTKDLREAVSLPHREDVPLVGMVSRMTSQKGFDLLQESLDDVMQVDMQLVMLASGDPKLEEFFREAERRYPGKLRLVADFDNRMAHRIQAGCNAFLMPSRFEPCGLTQMYAAKYGTAPVVRATGGLRDTVWEFDPATGKGNGFVFENYRGEELVAALGRMASTFKSPTNWRRVMQNCFACDFSWDRAAQNYLQWFHSLRRERNLE